MIKCLNSLICKEYRIEDDGLITLDSIYSAVTRKDMPTTISLCLVSFMVLSIKEYEISHKKELEVRVITIAPSGITIGDSHSNVTFRQISDMEARGNLIIQYGPTTFTEFGRYLFEIFYDYERLDSITLDIISEYKS